MDQSKTLGINNSNFTFSVNSNCIHCGSCWQIDSTHFASNGEKAYVQQQPDGQKEIETALLALVDCPVSAIRSSKKIREGIPPNIFPIPITSHDDGNIFYCGWSAKSSFGASSWLIRNPRGNVLIDSPRWSPLLAKQIEVLGGISQMVLTHKDDIADQAKWSEIFGCERIIHKGDLTAVPEAEKIIYDNNTVLLGKNLRLIPTPGHTEGSIVALLGNKRQIIFSGDHLWWNPFKEVIVASKEYCWWNWSEKINSIKKLLELDVALLLPGHGHCKTFKPGEWKLKLKQTLEYLKAIDTPKK